MCPCGSKFDIQHSMSCQKGGFVTIRHKDLKNKFDVQNSVSCKKGGFITIIHNDLRNLVIKILSEV